MAGPRRANRFDVRRFFQRGRLLTVTESSRPMAAKAICIVGAGAAGLAVLKTVLDSPQYKAGYWKPTAFESRDAIGGVWYILRLIVVPDHSTYSGSQRRPRARMIHPSPRSTMPSPRT